MSEKFTYLPSQWVPFRDKEVIDRVAAIKREDMEKHPNPDYKIRVVPDASVEHYMIEDMVRRLKESSDTGKNTRTLLRLDGSHRQTMLAMNCTSCMNWLTP